MGDSMHNFRRVVLAMWLSTSTGIVHQMTVLLAAQANSFELREDLDQEVEAQFVDDFGPGQPDQRATWCTCRTKQLSPRTRVVRRKISAGF